MRTQVGTAAGPDAVAVELDIIAQFLDAPSERTFGPVFRWFAPRLLRYFALRGCEKSLAEDLTQDAMLIAYRQPQDVRCHSNFRAWLFGVARNTHLMYLRHEGRCAERVEFEGLVDKLQAPSVDPLARSVLLESFEILDSVSQRILELRYLDGLEYHEIAEVLRLPLGTVQWKVFDSKKKLGKWMSGL